VLLKKRNRLLERLYALGWIDKTTLQTALLEPVPVNPLPMPALAPHLLHRMHSDKAGRVITSTIDAHLQEQSREIVLNQQEKLQFNQIHNAAAIIIEVETGAVLAYVGNSGLEYSNAHGGDVDIIRSPRSTGSLLKPVLYAAMLDDGKILPNSLVTDIPMNISGFAPKNFDGQFEGAVRANRALSRSLNVPAVEMLKEYGVDRFHHLLQDLGMKTLNRESDQYGLSLILGGAEGNLAEMTNIYACFSRVLNHFAETGLYYPGDYRSMQFVKSMSVPEKGETEPGFISASALWFTYNAMKEVNRPDAESGWKYFGSSGTIAWKTGTSFGYRDGWAIGTSPRYVVGVWVGNADGEGRPGLTGIAAAAPVLFRLFGLLPRSGWFKAPADELIPAVVCRKSGYLAGPNCDEADTVRVPLKGIHTPPCHYHRVVHLTSDRKYRVNRNCMMPERMIHCSWFVLPPVQEWYYKKMHHDYAGLPPFMTGCDEVNQRSMDLVYPGEGTTLYIPVGLSGKKSRVIFEAVHRVSDAVIYWHLDGQFICSTKNIHQAEVLPGKGKHTLVMIDEYGEELVRHFDIMEKDD
jgi:penicillin-binding protein 1C